MKISRFLVTLFALTALAVAGYSAANTNAKAKVADCCDAGACCEK